MTVSPGGPEDPRDAVHARLAAAQPSDEVVSALAQCVQECVAPGLVLRRLVDLSSRRESLDAVVSALALDPGETARLLVGIFVQSTYLTQTLLDDPALLGWLFRNQTVRYTTSREIYRRELADELAADEDAPRVLRRFRRRETFRIGVRDVLDIADIYTTALELSFLADVLIEAALDLAMSAVQRMYGRPRNGDGSPATMAVLALGKLGGEELNFSSDVDLVFVSSGEGTTSGAEDVPGARSVDTERFFTRVGTELISLLTSPTGDGIVYRVDVRLRPEGSRGSLVRTLSAAESYFTLFGQEWERQALLRARTVAGDAGLGRRFLATVTPFTFRKYVDEAAISETLCGIREMRLKTFAKYKDRSLLERDVKNGPGGIRDIEFTIQAIQMLYGGRYPEIRLASTFRSLERIHQSGLMTASDYRTLRAAYEFLRRVEHRIQMEESAQVYAIAEGGEPLDLLGRRLGFADGSTFLAEYRRHTRGVRAIYDDIFSQEHLQDDADLLLAGDLPRESYAPVLAKYGLDGEDWVPASIARLCEDARAPHLNTKLRRLVRGLLPRMLTFVRDSADPPLAMRNLERIVLADAASVRAAYFTALREQPEALAMLVTIAGSSRFLTELLMRSASRLDLLLSREGLAPFASPVELAERWTSYRPEGEVPTDAEEGERLSRLRRWKGRELLRLGAAYLLGVADAGDTYRSLSQLAGFVLERVLAEQVSRLAGELGLGDLDPASFGLALLALGKFGGGECTFGSDLDVVFVYDGEPEWFAERKDRLDATLVEYYTRCATRLLRTMNATTAAGTLFETDARLRPYGKNSPMVLSLSGYRSYYESRQDVWERLMLTRARFACGEPRCGQAFEEMAREIVTGHPWTAETRDAIRHMRGRIEDAKQADPIKAGSGGMIDVEFLAQAAQIRFGRRYPDLCRPSTVAALQALAQHSLCPRLDLDGLLDSYAFLRDMETAIRVVDNTSLDAMPAEPARLESLVRRIYQAKRQTPPSVAQVLDEYEFHRRRIREAFDAFLAEE